MRRPASSTPAVTGDACGEPSRRLVIRMTWCRGRTKSSSPARSTYVFVAIFRATPRKLPEPPVAIARILLAFVACPGWAKRCGAILDLEDLLASDAAAAAQRG